MKIILPVIILFLYLESFGTTYAPLYPYTQYTENGNIKCNAVPYSVYDGGKYGETFIYSGKKLLYSIDKYFTNPFFTVENGKYIVEFDFHLRYKKNLERHQDLNGNWYVDKPTYDGEVIRIYESGKLFKVIEFNELNIDTSTLKITDYFFSWNYNYSDTNSNHLKEMMKDNPAFLINNILTIISCDDKLIKVNIRTGHMEIESNAYLTMTKFENWTPTEFSRTEKRLKYPNKFILPRLRNHTSLESEIAKLLGVQIGSREKGSECVSIYIHTLLINKEGKCEKVFVSPSSNSETERQNYAEIKEKIESWILNQVFETKTFPKHFQKYKYTGFIYLTKK